MLKQRRIAARQYRNRRIGDFLKELHLTEGRSSGFPLIRRALENNGSPPPKFITDTDKTYFLAVIKSHPEFKNVIVSDRANDRAGIPGKLLDINNIEGVKALIDFLNNKRSDRDSDRDNDRANDIVNDIVNDIANDIANDIVDNRIRDSVNQIVQKDGVWIYRARYRSCG